jgi:glyoxylase-like metal-dependent hydrolase (beta-lactamase superfamily II)
VLARDGRSTVVVDPGMVRGPELILDPMTALDVAADDVTDVVLSHHHPDHTWHIALFPRARVHDVWAVCQGDQWDDQPAEGRRATDLPVLHASRERLLGLEPVRIVPGHGPAFVPDDATPR